MRAFDQRARCWIQALAACLIPFAGASAHAEAGGPDFYDVHGVREGHSLRLRAEPRVDAPVLARIRHDGACLANRGCVGGITFEEFTTLPEDERREIERTRPRWCRVDFDGREGWVAGRFLRESSGACHERTAARTTASGAGVSRQPDACRGAMPGSFEAMRCASPQLAALDAEVQRLRALLADGSGDPAIGDTQGAWLAERDACASAEDPERCARDRTLERVARLRASGIAASQDAAGISRGPVNYRCEQTEGLLTATFVNGDPPFAHVLHGGRVRIYQQVPAASGAKYQGASPEELFWSKDETALFRAGAESPELSCQRLE